MLPKVFFILFLFLLGVVLFFNPNFKTISAGIAILLFGMILLEKGFKVFTKGPLQNILKKSTDKLYKSIGLGAIVTAFIQSSSLVSVITISFISAGLISLAAGIGLIFGANIGTTATAWLVAGFGLKVKISALAMPMLVFGVIFSFQKSSTLKGFGNVLAGLGFFFLGIHFMKEGFDVFSEYIDLTEYAVPGFLGVLIYAGLGIVITAILQSSSASLALILTALAAGQIEYGNALALAVGTNIGTTITALLGSVGSNVAGKRLAVAHFIFNIFTGIVALVFIKPLAYSVDILSNILGILPQDYTLKLALFHTLFNIIGVAIMIPLINRLEKFLLGLFKEKTYQDVDEPKYLNESVLKFPSSAISSLLQETKYLYQNAIFEIITHALSIHRKDILGKIKINQIIKKSEKDFEVDVRDLYVSKVKTIYSKIIESAVKIQSTLDLNEEQNARVSEIKIANRKMIEIIRDVKELGRNVSKYILSDNIYIRKEYNKFRKKIIRVMRIINLFKTSENRELYYTELLNLKKKAKKDWHQSNKSINKLIKDNLITANMASSLVNDKDNVNDIIKKLIQVAELIYGEKDSILENDS